MLERYYNVINQIAAEKKNPTQHSFFSVGELVLADQKYMHSNWGPLGYVDNKYI